MQVYHTRDAPVELIELRERCNDFFQDLDIRAFGIVKARSVKKPCFATIGTLEAMLIDMLGFLRN
jgi:hypothetical protein